MAPNIHKGATTNAVAQIEKASDHKVSSAPESRNLLSWATISPDNLGVDTNPHDVMNCVGGVWVESTSRMSIPHPLDKDAPPLFTIPDTQLSEVQPFIDSLRNVSKSGMHNPLKNPDRYVQFGNISRKAGAALEEPEIADFFARLIIKCVPKSYGQAMGEVKVTASFLNNFGGDNVRRLAKSFGVPGDYYGQMSVGHR